MITLDGKVVRKVVPPSGKVRVEKQDIHQRDGITGTWCAVCGKFTRLYHQVRITTGYTKVTSTNQGWKPNHTWYSYDVVRSAPVKKTYWVCEAHYSDRVGEPIIPLVDHKLVPLGIEKAQLRNDAKVEAHRRESPLGIHTTMLITRTPR